MSEPIKLVAFCGSLRKASVNRLALHAFIERLPKGVTVETLTGTPELTVAGEEPRVVVDVLRHALPYLTVAAAFA